MSEWLFLSKGGEDPYINQFASGCKTPITNSENYDIEDDTSNAPIVLRGILKKKIMQKCWKTDRTFYYMDTGYFGNEKMLANPNAWKYWHRIVKNDLQHGEIIARSDDRFKQFNKQFSPWKKNGRKILIAKPDEKPMKFYGLDLDQWLEETVNTIKQHTDRPIEIRERNPNRIDRAVNNTLQTALDNDVFALVTFNSVAAVESIFYGIPAFTLAPANAASPVALQDLSKIDSPYYPDKDKLYAWGCHLAYGQFHINELRSGAAKEMLENTK
jgi:hypothetical protein